MMTLVKAITEQMQRKTKPAAPAPEEQKKNTKKKGRKK